MIRWIILLVLVLVAWRVVRSLLPAPGAGPGRRPAAPPGWDPYAVLGVARDASGDEIAQAYREQMKAYHPDRVASLGPELQELAHRKAVDIQRAYDELRRR